MGGVLIIVIGLVFVVLAILAISATLFRKVGPNQALIVYGFGGTKVVKGSGKVVWPMVQQARELSLELMSFDVAPTQDLYTSQGVAVNVEAVAQIKVKSDPVSILTAAEQFLTKPPEEREALIRLVMEGHLRGIVGQLTVEEIVKEPEMVADRMRANVADDMSKMGLEVISFTIKEVRDGNDYILNMGRPNIALVQREADIATAEADRDTAIKRAQRRPGGPHRRGRRPAGRSDRPHRQRNQAGGSDPRPRAEAGRVSTRPSRPSRQPPTRPTRSRPTSSSSASSRSRSRSSRSASRARSRSRKPKSSAARRN